MQGTNEKCDLFYMIWDKIEDIFPLMKRRTHPNDKPWMNSKIKQLIAERQRAHHSDNVELKKQKARKKMRKSGKLRKNTMPPKCNTSVMPNLTTGTIT